MSIMLLQRKAQKDAAPPSGSLGVARRHPRYELGERHACQSRANSRRRSANHRAVRPELQPVPRVCARAQSVSWLPRRRRQQVKCLPYLYHKKLRRAGRRRSSVLLYLRKISLRRPAASGNPLQGQVRRERHRKSRGYQGHRSKTLSGGRSCKVVVLRMRFTPLHAQAAVPQLRPHLAKDVAPAASSAPTWRPTPQSRGGAPASRVTPRISNVRWPTAGAPG
jgi:hypothetical protein